jgi:aldehyde dehydrogenase (NAD+)/betaine-aldehyde dehydrogenase
MGYQETDHLRTRRSARGEGARQAPRAESYIRSGIEEGAKLLIGGAEAPEGLDTLRASDRLLRGQPEDDHRPGGDLRARPLDHPVDSEEEAIEVANDSKYGLSGAVWAKDPDRALAVARRLRTRQVDLNGGAFNGDAPFGGYKQSGNGRERGRFGLDEFLETKSLQR